MLYVVFGICWYNTSGCCVATDVSAYTGIYQIRNRAYKKFTPDDGLIQLKTCTAYIEK